jgi:hypothetical protein
MNKHSLWSVIRLGAKQSPAYRFRQHDQLFIGQEKGDSRRLLKRAFCRRKVTQGLCIAVLGVSIVMMTAEVVVVDPENKVFAEDVVEEVVVVTMDEARARTSGTTITTIIFLKRRWTSSANVSRLCF